MKDSKRKLDGITPATERSFAARSIRDGYRESPQNGSITDSCLGFASCWYLLWKPPIPPQIDPLLAPSRAFHLDTFLFQPIFLPSDPLSLITSWRDNTLSRDHSLRSILVADSIQRERGGRTCHGTSVSGGSIFIALPTCLNTPWNVNTRSG